MKEITVETRIRIFPASGLPDGYHALARSAVSAAKNAYAPYSGFHVGAAVLLENGEVVTGNNQENAAYPSGLCAERVALFYATARYPDSAVRAIAVAAFSEGRQVTMVSPCGSCRQVLLEVENRFKRPVSIILCGAEQCYVADSAASLLPLCFDVTALSSAHTQSPCGEEAPGSQDRP
ncbi:MAG: cytidine deaminase [Tannerellaceae bacterium]|jgi:cytidine deaminase|nr:cytidine deaminase [Tannerellaceae bacterium]